MEIKSACVKMKNARMESKSAWVKMPSACMEIKSAWVKCQALGWKLILDNIRLYIVIRHLVALTTFLLSRFGRMLRRGDLQWSNLEVPMKISWSSGRGFDSRAGRKLLQFYSQVTQSDLIRGIGMLIVMLFFVDDEYDKTNLVYRVHQVVIDDTLEAPDRWQLMYYDVELSHTQYDDGAPCDCKLQGLARWQPVQNGRIDDQAGGGVAAEVRAQMPQGAEARADGKLMLLGRKNSRFDGDRASCCQWLRR